MKKKIVILSVYPFAGAPSQRFRFEQQLPYLLTKYDVKQLSFWSEKTNSILYLKGNIVRKSWGIFIGLIKRFFHLYSCLNADVILIHREIIPLGSVFFEKIISIILKKKIIFDFDDAIWKIDSSKENKKFEWLKSDKKTADIIQLSTVVIAGNEYLSKYAKQFNSKVVVIPTTIDVSYHKASPIKNTGSVCIGWTGSKTTIKHFELLIPVLKKIKEKYGEKVYFKLIGDETYYNSELNLMGTKWSLKTEIKDLQEIDIGIMPLPDDDWAKGKCGFKGLQYMALENPPIMSPVGVNTEIITSGINGFLASTNDDWIDKLSILIEDEFLRNKIGVEARKTIIKDYSVTSNQDKYLTIFEALFSH